MWILGLLGLPLVEIALFVVVGGAIGLWPTLGLVVFAAIAGVVLIRLHGFHALAGMRRSLEAGEDPVGPLAHGALTVLAGLLLILPGFFTDALALGLLLPPVRRLIIARLGAQVSVRMAAARAGHPRRPAGAETIEGEFEYLDDTPPGPPGRSGWTQPH